MAIARKNSFVLPKAWAEDGSTVIPNPPVAGTTYRDETVDEANIAEGQTYDGVADSARWNQLLYMMTSIMQDCLAHGILPWINTQDYLEGAVVMGSNGNLYKALAASKSVDPTTDDTGKWELAGTINPAKVAAPMSYSSDEGLKLNLGNSMQVASNKLDAKLKANSGLRIGTDGIYAHLNSNFLRPDANDNGRLGGSVQEFSGNIDLLTSINTTAFYVLKSSSTGTKPEGMNTFWLACIGGAQIAIYGSDMAVRSYDQSAQTWNKWKTISKMGS